VIGKSKNSFTEKSLLQAALILQHLKEYRKALANFEELEQTAGDQG
jgi:hypothetical protein